MALYSWVGVTQIGVSRDSTWSSGLLDLKNFRQVLHKIITFIKYTSSTENRIAMMMMNNWCHLHHCIPSHKAPALGIEIARHKQICAIVATLKRNFTFICFRRHSNGYSRQIAMSLLSYLLYKVLGRRFLRIKTANE